MPKPRSTTSSPGPSQLERQLADLGEDVRGQQVEPAKGQHVMPWRSASSTTRAQRRTLVDRPDDERLPAPGIACGEDTLRRGREPRCVGVAARDRARRRAARGAPAPGCRKPMASRTSSAGCSSAVPSIGANGGAPSFRAQWMRSTLPFAAREVGRRQIAKSRVPPSSSAYDVRSFIGHRGHGVSVVGSRGWRLADQLDLGHRGGGSRDERARRSLRPCRRRRSRSRACRLR